MRGMVFVLVAGCGFQIDLSSSVDPDAALVENPDSRGDAIPADAPGAIDGPSNLPGCPNGYGPVNGLGKYRVVEGTDRTWEAAAADCADDDDVGGPYAGFTHLVVLGSDNERDVITGASSPISGNTWIGLSDRALEGAFNWVTAEPTNGYPMVGQEPPWDSDDPDDAGGNEDCVRFKNTYVLEDKPCTDTESFVCECDAFPPL